LPTEPADESAQSGPGGKPYTSKIPSVIMDEVMPALGGFYAAEKLEEVKAVIASPEMDTQIFNVLYEYCYGDQDFDAFIDDMAAVIRDIGAQAQAELQIEDVGAVLSPFEMTMGLMCMVLPEKPLLMCNATQAEVLSACPFYTPDIVDIWMSGADPEKAIFADVATVCMAENCTKAIAESGCYDTEAVIMPLMGLCGCHAKLIVSNNECASILSSTSAAYVDGVESVATSLPIGLYDADSPAAMALKEASAFCPAADGTPSTCMTAMMDIQECAVLENDLTRPALSSICCVQGVIDEPDCAAMLPDLVSMGTDFMNSPAMQAMALMANPSMSTEDKVASMKDAGFDNFGKLMTGMYTGGICETLDLSAMERCAPKMACLDTLGDADMTSGRRLMAGHEYGGDQTDESLSEGMEQLNMLCDPEACGTKILEECLSIPLEPVIAMQEMEEAMMSGRRLLELRRSLLAGHDMPQAVLLGILEPLKELMTGEGNGTMYDLAREQGPEIIAGICRQECYDTIASCKDKPDLFGLGDNSEVEPTCAEIESASNDGSSGDDEGSSAVSAAARFAPALFAAAAALAMA